MKKVFIIGAALSTVLLLGNLSAPNDNKILAQTKDTILPNWQWNSGEVEMHKTAAKECFTISFNPAIYHPRDSIKITFTSYKVTMTGLNKGTTFEKWVGKVNLVYFINDNWLPLDNDTNDRINQPFSNHKNIASDSLTDYTLRFTVPLSRTLTITTSAIAFEMDEADGHGKPICINGAPTLTTSIRGIEVKKLE